MKDFYIYFCNYINNNPFDSLSLLIGSLGICSSCYFYFKSKKSRIPTYIIRTVNLIRENIQKIETIDILYANNKINNLSISKIALWNNGKETINSCDIAQNNPLRLSINNGYIFLEAKVIYEKNTANDFSLIISEDNKSIFINFDYFDFEEGVVIQTFHTGKKSSDICLLGQIKAVKKINRKDYPFTILPKEVITSLANSKIFNQDKTLQIILGWTILFCGIIFALPFFDYSLPKALFFPLYIEDKSYSTYIFPFMGFVYILTGYQMIKRRIPKGFNIFDEEL